MRNITRRPINSVLLGFLAIKFFSLRIFSSVIVLRKSQSVHLDLSVFRVEEHSPKGIMLLKSATWVAFVLFFLLVIWTEFLLFYVSLLRCTWPQISESTVDKFIYPGDNSKPVKILLISDTHIGSRHQWIDKTRRHWLLKRAFKTAMGLYHPDVVLHLGDLLDYGFFEPEEAFEADVKIAQNIFAVDSTTVFKVVPGNHDIGFHHRLHPYTYARFHRAFRDHSPGTRAGPDRKSVV